MHLARYYPILGALLAVLVDPPTGAQECGTLVPLITGDQYKVTDDQITASSFLNSTHLPSDVRLPSGSAWCTEEPDPWLQIDFGADIVIHTLSISGSSFSQVTSFQIQSATASSGELQHLTTQESEAAHLFNVSATRDSVSNVTLPATLVAVRLRILPSSWDVSSPSCLRLEVYGCLLNPACVPEVGLSPSSELLPVQNIVGSSLKILASLLTEGMSACFNYTVKQTYITLNFTQPVIITRATSLYAQQFSDGYQNMTAYVDTFTIGTSADGKHFTTYTDTTGRKEILTQRANTFWKPVKTEQYLRLTITNATTAFGIVCWQLDLYGCVDSADHQTVSSLSMTSSLPAVRPSTPIVMATTLLPSPSPFTTPTPVLVSEKEEEEEEEEEEKEDGAVGENPLVLWIVLPIATVTIVIVMVCVMGVAVGMHHNRTKLKLLEPPCPAAQSNIEGDATIKILYNTLYSSRETSPDQSEEPGLMFLQSMQSAPPTLRASQYEVPIDSMTNSQTRPSLGYTSVQFTSCPATLEDVPTQESHMYESVQCVQNTTRSEEDIEQSVGEVVAHPQPTSPESDYELMESVRYYREEISHGEEERMNDGKETNHEGEMRHEEETRHHMAASVEVQGDDFSISDAPSTACV